MISRLLNKFTNWALSKNPPGGYAGEDDERWAYTIETEGDPYLTRVLLSRWLPIKKWFGIGIYLHHFHRPDIDQHLHNHPWTWGMSFVLSGSYTEERLEGFLETMPPQILTDTRRVSRFNFIRDTDYHKVKELHGDVWTLFITGRRHENDWGFLVDGVHVPWTKYLSKDSKYEPVKDQERGVYVLFPKESK